MTTKPTRELFICETSDGLREIWNPSDEEMAALGWVRIEHAAAYVAKNPCDRATWNGNGAVSVTAVDEGED